MSKSIFYCEYKLKKNVSETDFLDASKKLNDNYISKQKGYISWEQWNNGDTWVDILAFETMEEVKAFEENSAASPNELAISFYSFINMPSCKVRYYSVGRAHGDAK